MHYHIRESRAATSEQQLTLEAHSFSKQRKQAKHGQLFVKIHHHEFEALRLE